MPELWIPYGPVETLVTLQAENLGTVVGPATGEVQDVSQEGLLDGVSSVYVCDSSPPTMDLLRMLAPSLASTPGMKLLSATPKRVESAVPEVKGRISTLPPPIAADATTVTLAHELMEQGGKLFMATAKPDPFFGLVDARVQACLNWAANSHGEAAKDLREMEPSPFQKTEPYSRLEALAARVPQGRFATVVPGGGKFRSVLVDAPFDALKGGFPTSEVQPSRGLIVGAGGSGYDDSLSTALRGLWGALPGLRRSGTLLIMAECSEGLGSPALEMLATGRLSGEGQKRRGRYVEGLEEVSYLGRLKLDYDVLLLSSLPEVYAKSKLGISTARGSGEAVGRLLNKTGKSARINVVVRASESRVSSG